MKTIYITLTIILLSLAIEVIAFKPLEFEQARRLHAKYNSISNKRDRLSFKKSLTKNYGPELANHISQVPYNARKLFNPWEDIKETWTGFKGKMSTLFEKAKDPSQYIPPVVSATLNDVKREMTKAKRVLDTTVARINQDLMKMNDALKNSVKSYYGSIMKSVEKYRVDISGVVS